MAHHCMQRWLRGVTASIRRMPKRKRLPAFDHDLYRKRNLVERFFNKLKQFRAVATRYDRCPTIFFSATVLVWL